MNNFSLRTSTTSLCLGIFNFLLLDHEPIIPTITGYSWVRYIGPITLPRRVAQAYIPRNFKKDKSLVVFTS